MPCSALRNFHVIGWLILACALFSLQRWSQRSARLARCSTATPRPATPPPPARWVQACFVQWPLPSRQEPETREVPSLSMAGRPAHPAATAVDMAGYLPPCLPALPPSHAQVFDSMQELGTPANVKIYTSLIDACVQARDDDWTQVRGCGAVHWGAAHPQECAAARLGALPMCMCASLAGAWPRVANARQPAEHRPCNATRRVMCPLHMSTEAASFPFLPPISNAFSWPLNCWSACGPRAWPPLPSRTAAC